MTMTVPAQPTSAGPPATSGRNSGLEFALSAPQRAMIDDVVAAESRADRRQTWLLMVGRVAFVAFVLGLWELGANRVFDEFFFSKPSAVARSLWEGFTERDLLRHTYVTMVEAVLGYIVGAITALLAAIAAIWWPRAYRLVEPIMVAIYGIPRIALAPMFILWLGIGLSSKVIIAAFMTFFVVFMNSVAGLAGVNRNLIQVSRMMGGGRIALLYKVMLPSALPYIMTALKIVVPTAMIGALVGEFISSQRGLGFFIRSASAGFDIALSFAAVIVLMVTVLTFNGLVALAERRLMRWRQFDGAVRLDR